MCNAWNHRPGCTCGWGGDGHLGSASGGGWSWNAASTWSGGPGLDSPNAHCPVCDASVFFVRPHNGGSLWLDEMGPPWPKHPCLDDHEHRQQFPQPTRVPAFRTEAPPVSGSSTRYTSFFIYFNESESNWSLNLDGERLVSLVKPPAALSPLFVNWQEPDREFARVEYIATRNGEPTAIVLRVYPRELFEWWSPRRLQPDDPWAFLQLWVEDQDVATAAAADFVEQLRESIEWLLETHWAYTETGPALVMARIERLCQKYETLNPLLVFGWVKILLR